MGSDYKKPDATTLLTRENFKQLLYPLPVNALLCVGKSTEETLKKLSVRTIGDLASCDIRVLYSHLGSLGVQLYRSALGDEREPVRSLYVKPGAKSVSTSFTFSRDLTNYDDLALAVRYLSDVTARRIREQGLKGSVAHLSLKTDKLKLITRQSSLPYPTDLAEDIAQCMLSLMALHRPASPVRMASVGVSALSDAAVLNAQLTFFRSDEHKKNEKVEKTVDLIREKYGKTSIFPASYLGNSIGIHY